MKTAQATAGRDVVIIASGGANIASLQYALERLECRSEISADPQRIRRASHVILPGRGGGWRCHEAAARTRPADGDPDARTTRGSASAWGMQLLYESSEEGQAECLGIIPGRATRFTAAEGRPVPHMGWNTLEPNRASPLLEGLNRGDHAYFVHSYALSMSDATIASCDYGVQFSACVQWRNLLRRAIPPRALGRGRLTPAAQLSLPAMKNCQPAGVRPCA